MMLVMPLGIDLLVRRGLFLMGMLVEPTSTPALTDICVMACGNLFKKMKIHTFNDVVLSPSSADGLSPICSLRIPLSKAYLQLACFPF